jgi:hypothetical protein
MGFSERNYRGAVMKFFRIIILPFVILLIVLGCAPKATKAVRPNWCDNPPAHTPSTLYFVSLSETYQTESTARESAMGKAPKMVLDYIGSEIEASYTESINSQGSAAEGMTTKAAAQLFVQQVSKGIVRSLSPVEWYTEKYSNGDYQTCVLTQISKASIDTSLREAKQKAEEKRQRILGEISALIKASDELAGKGRILPALKSLNRAKKRIQESGVQTTKVNISEIEVAERAIISRLKLSSISPLKIELESIEKKQDLELKVVYQTTTQETPQEGFPLAFKYENVYEKATTDFQGTARHMFKSVSEKSRVSVAVSADESSLKGIVSKEALKDLLAKGVTYQISIKIDDLIPMPLASDFNLKLWTENDQASFDVNELFKIKYSCYTQRCFLKIFAYEIEGPIAVIKDINKKRLTVDKIKSFKLKGDTPGQIMLYVIASSDAFPIGHSRNRTIKRGDFRGMIKTLRQAPGKKAEYRLTVSINK